MKAKGRGLFLIVARGGGEIHDRSQAGTTGLIGPQMIRAFLRFGPMAHRNLPSFTVWPRPLLPLSGAPQLWALISGAPTRCSFLRWQPWRPPYSKELP